MRYITTKNLRKGMLLARDVYNDKGALAFKEGAKLSNSQIENVKKLGFAGVYILDVCSDDIMCEPVVPEHDYLNAVRAVEDYVRRAALSEAGQQVHVTEEEQRRVVDPILEALLGKHRLVIDVFDIKPFAIYEPCHAAMVMVLSVAIGIKLKMGEAQLYDLATAALLHDIGTAFLPEGILNRPGRLTDEEFDMVKNHVRKGYEYLLYNHSLSEAASVGVMQHHENYDGTGYPDGLRRKNISVYGRIIAVTDVYDALVSKRSFRQAMYPAQALDIIEQQSDRKFDPDIVGALASFVAPYPSGTIVSLKTGETCIVKRNYQEDLSRPLLRVYNEKSSAGQLIDLHKDPAFKGSRIVKTLDV